MTNLNNLKVAVLATDGFEESELTEPVKALRHAGAKVDIVSLKPGEIQGFKHHDKAGKVKVDCTLQSVSPSDYHALMLPGGALNADQMRADDAVKRFVAAIAASNKPIAAICHAPWILVSANLLKGRRLTSYHSIQDDVRNAGGIWSDEEVVVDGLLVTSRQPDDLPAFNREMINLFSNLAPGKIDEAMSA